MSIFFGLIFNTFLAQGSQTISDSIVEDLNCAHLNERNVLTYFKKDRLNPNEMIPFENWPFKAAGAPLAACWSLAHAQRLFMYLAQQNGELKAEDRVPVLNMIRGSAPYSHEGQMKEDYNIRYSVFSFGRLQNEFSWALLLDGVNENLGEGVTLNRNFKNEIEKWQTTRFFNPANLRLIAGNGPRRAKENRKSISEIVNLIENKEFPLIILRPIRKSQHVVLGLDYEKMVDGGFEIRVYDSNQPNKKVYLKYNSADSQFYGEDIIGGLPGVSDPKVPLGVFITGQNEIKEFKKVLFARYRDLCKPN